MALLGGLVALSPLAPAKAWDPSTQCDDSSPTTVHLVSGQFGLPLFVAIEEGPSGGVPEAVGICYRTAPSGPQIVGGYAAVHAHPGSTGTTAVVANSSDSSAANGANFFTRAEPTYTVSPGGTSGGQVITFRIPVDVCSGPCQPGTQPFGNATGVIVGTITQVQPEAGGMSAAYQLSSLCVQVNGVDVLGCGDDFSYVGATTTGAEPVSTATGTPGPCVVGACAPQYDYVGTTGNQIATVYVPDLGTFPVYGVHSCLYTKDASTTCPS